MNVYAGFDTFQDVLHNVAFHLSFTLHPSDTHSSAGVLATSSVSFLPCYSVMKKIYKKIDTFTSVIPYLAVLRFP